ncbi:hypothetical protein WA538_005400 [Blastocystis sp. DL]
MGDGLGSELEEAVQESSPYKYTPMEWLPEQIRKDPSIADRLQDYYKRCVKNLPPTKRMEWMFSKKMNLPEIWDTDLEPLAPVCRPKDIPKDHEVDLWTYRDWRNVALTGSTEPPSDPELEKMYTSEDGSDARLLFDLDPRVTSLSQKLLEPILSKKDSFEGLARAVDLNVSEDADLEAESFQVTHEKQEDTLDVEGAKRLMRRALRSIHMPGESIPQSTDEESMKESIKESMKESPKESPYKNEAFNVTEFRQLVQGYQAEATKGGMTRPFGTGFTIKVRHVDKKKANMTRRLSSALVCSGTQTGGLAVGYARSEKSPDAVMKADASSVNHRLFLELYEDRTLFAPLEGKFNQTRVKILPARKGHGIKGSDLMYGLLTSLGVQDAICKVYGNTNPFSVTQAAMKALSKSMSVEEQALRTGRRYFDLNAIYKRTKAMQD